MRLCVDNAIFCVYMLHVDERPTRTDHHFTNDQNEMRLNVHRIMTVLDLPQMNRPYTLYINVRVCVRIARKEFN